MSDTYVVHLTEEQLQAVKTALGKFAYEQVKEIMEKLDNAEKERD